MPIERTGLPDGHLSNDRVPGSRNDPRDEAAFHDVSEGAGVHGSNPAPGLGPHADSASANVLPARDQGGFGPLKDQRSQPRSGPSTATAADRVAAETVVASKASRWTEPETDSSPRSVTKYSSPTKDAFRFHPKSASTSILQPSPAPQSLHRRNSSFTKTLGMVVSLRLSSLTSHGLRVLARHLGHLIYPRRR